MQENVKNGIAQMAKNGFDGATYIRQGRIVKYSIEGVVRRDTLTAVHKLANQVSEKACEELGAEYVEISQHLGARTHPTNPIANHAGWQGKVFKINGSDDKYPNLKESTGYPDDILGLGGVNCRHRMFPFFPGISIPNPIMYSEEENEKAYKASQGQRRLEREIRQRKKEKASMKAIGDNDAVKAIDYKLQQKFTQIDNYCDAHNLKRDYSRELVSEQIVKNNLTTLSDNDNIELQSEQSTEKVKNFNFEYFSDEVNLKLTAEQQNLRDEVSKFTDKTEIAYAFDMNMNRKEIMQGSKGQGKVNIKIPDYDFIAIHNHKSNGAFSLGDIDLFARYQNLKCMIVVGNKANQYCLYRKTSNANVVTFYADSLKYMNNLKLLYKNNKITLEEALNLSESIYKEANKYGLEFRKI